MMSKQKRQDWRFLFAGAVLVSSLLVMWEWFTSVEHSLARGGGEVTMKPLTSYLFVLIAVAQMFNLAEKREAAKGIAASIVLWLPMLMIAGYEMGFVVPFTDDAVLSVGKGVPSIGTAICFLLLVGAVFRPSRSWYVVVRSLAMISLAGYALERFLHIIEAPLLYWYLPNISTAMALPTAALLFLLSFARHA